MLHFPLALINRLNKNECAVFKLCRFSIFRKDPFFQFGKIYCYVLLLLISIGNVQIIHRKFQMTCRQFKLYLRREIMTMELCLMFHRSVRKNDISIF